MELDLKEVQAVEMLMAEIDVAASEQLANLQLAFGGGGLGDTAI
jgi:hypothetical protein